MSEMSADCEAQQRLQISLEMTFSNISLY